MLNSNVTSAYKSYIDNITNILVQQYSVYTLKSGDFYIKFSSNTHGLLFISREDAAETSIHIIKYDHVVNLIIGNGDQTVTGITSGQHSEEVNVNIGSGAKTMIILAPCKITVTVPS